MTSLSEYRTRKEKIDVQLKRAGWDINNPAHVVIEVDTKQSDFTKHDYKTVRETLRDPNIDEKAYADYLLLDKSGSPLAIIEAKRTSKDPILGQKQAEDYADDIERQTRKDVFIFLTNGYEIWFWNKVFENPRMVKGFHSREALERIKYQNTFRKNFLDVPIKKEIVDRPYQIEAVKRVLEGLEKGRRKFLIVHATGTGKTRVAMALVDVLLRANRAQKVLFLADRIELRRQAYNEGFKEFFPNELKTSVISGSVDKTRRLFASTIQTFMGCYQDFSIGDFDVIISDECHRSIYNKWKDVFTYFDAIEIGLTATPAELIGRDTFRFFNCQNKIPTHLYTYEQALEDKWLAPFKVYKTRTHFQIAGVKPEDVPREVLRKLLEKGIEPEDINFEGTDIEKKVVVIGTNEAIVKEFMEQCVRDSTGTLPAKSIFFAITKKHAKRLWEAFERLYPEHKGQLTRIITSENPRANQLLTEFKKKDMPRVAISVDKLDTGVNVPEVCNLVFAKPVFSKIKFWQMIGRGTRHDRVCTHKKWLPNKKKEGFLIFDCWSVFEWFNMYPEGIEAKPSEAVTTKIFLIRLHLLNYFQKTNDSKNTEMIKSKLLVDINNLPLESVTIQEHSRDLELARSSKLWTRVGINPINFLKSKIAPLMKYRTNVNYNEASYIQKCEELSLAILTRNQAEVERLKETICAMLECLPLTIREVKKKERDLDLVLSTHFWENITYESAQLLLNDFAPLMKYKRSEPRPKIILDIDDVMEERELIEYGPILSPRTAYVGDYRDKIERKIRNLAAGHPTIIKIERGETITEEDLRKLEETLNSPDLYITEETLQHVYKQYRGTLVEFIKKILGLYKFPEPEKVIEEAFKTFMIERDYFNADQVNFLRTIQTVFSKRKHIGYSDLYDPPFTSFGADAVLRLFRKEDVEEVLELCKNLEVEVFRRV